jgi:ABC-type multidrug transport system permease subunit
MWLGLVVFSTSLAAVGLAMLVASLARTEIQVILFGGVAVVIMALIGGCVLPREMMPENTQFLSHFTPHGWSLDAYRELLATEIPGATDLSIVAESCAVLVGFGLSFLALAWVFLRLD